MNETYFRYKNRPVVRCGNELYLGSAAKEYVVWLQVDGEGKDQDLSVCSDIRCILMKTDVTLPPDQLIANQTTRQTLFEALELGSVWLTQVHC